MITAYLEKKTYSLPVDWKDLTLKTFIDSQELAKEMPKTLDEIHFPKDVKEDYDYMDKLDDIQKESGEDLDFKRRWIALLSGIPEDSSKKLRIHDNLKEFGLYTMYKWMSTFLYMPHESHIQPGIEHKGKSYFLPEEKDDVLGKKIPMGHATWEEYTGITELKKQISKGAKADFSTLSMIMAILFAPKVKVTKKFLGFKIKDYEIREPFDLDKAKARAKEFEDLKMNVVWGAYFFLIRWMNTSSANIQSSIIQEVYRTGLGGTPPQKN